MSHIPPTPQAADDPRSRSLERMGRDYSSQHGMLREPMISAGYHSGLTAGEQVHPTRESLQYALHLLDAGDAESLERAQAILRAVIRLQDTDLTSPTFGVWPWTLEEPLSAMDPPDLNWADFCGVRLVQALKLYPGRLNPEVYGLVVDAAERAAWAIFRRNTGPEYTNIAVMGAVVVLVVAELKGLPLLLDFGRARLRAIVELTGCSGRFAEFNSPTYTVVALDALDQLFALVGYEVSRRDAGLLHERLWEMVAEHFHPATQQWAGPHSRAYSDLLLPDVAGYVKAATGLPIKCLPVTRDGQEPAKRTSGESVEEAGPIAWRDAPEPFRLIQPQPCPAHLKPRFEAMPTDPLEIKRVYIEHNDGQETVGTTWMTGSACLGSVNHSFGWVQRRSLVGYWSNTADDPVARLRLRVLKDGRDFSSIALRMEQQGPRVVLTAGPASGAGDHHPLLDCPEDSVFRFKELVLRFELTAQNATVDTLAPGTFALTAGDWRAAIHSPPGEWAGQPIRTRVVKENAGCVCVDVVLFVGTETAFDFTSLKCRVGAAVELLEAGQTPSASVGWEEGGEGLVLSWPSYDELTVPAVREGQPIRW